MPVRITQNQQTAGGIAKVLHQQERANADAVIKSLQRHEFVGPFNGMAPDVPHKMLDMNSSIDISGLIYRSDISSSGSVLTNLPGYEKETDYAPAMPARQIVRLDTFNAAKPDGSTHADTSESPMAIVAGDGSVGTQKLYRLVPSNNTWTEVPYVGLGDTGQAASGGVGNYSNTNLAASATYQGSLTGTEPFFSMPDSCVFAGGAPARTIHGTDSTTGYKTEHIQQPVFIFTNNKDPVYVYPAYGVEATSNYAYAPLTDKLGTNLTTTTSVDRFQFKAVSCETFGDRVYFLNVFEGGARHSQRLRRTARGTADPDPANVGGGYIEFDNFAGKGLRVETLGNILACYFTDGVAFVRETGVATSPNAVQVLDQTRSLVGTHALTPISNNEHFGIFQDGWWILDSNGRWREVGVGNANGTQIEKWKRTFYNLCDTEVNGYRVQCTYDPSNRWVYIVVPRDDNVTDTVWIYDVAEDKVWVDDYSAPGGDASSGGVTVFGYLITRDDAAITWADMVADTWDTIEGTWSSQTPDAGTRKMFHGNDKGILYKHSNILTTKDGQPAAWYMETPKMGSRWLHTIDRIRVEHVNSRNGNDITVEAKASFGGARGVGNTVSGSSALDVGEPNEIETTNNTLRLSDENIGVRLSGIGPIRILALYVDMLETQTQRR